MLAKSAAKPNSRSVASHQSAAPSSTLLPETPDFSSASFGNYHYSSSPSQRAPERNPARAAYSPAATPIQLRLDLDSLSGTDRLKASGYRNSLSAPVQLEQQTQPNNTGLPDKLKAGIENLSGLSLDKVKVHYNSSEPLRLNALAYTQGTDIHVAPDQEQYLPHETWHVAQQAQGRVKPTMQMKGGVQINDDGALEREADLMGGRAMQMMQEQKPSLAPLKTDADVSSKPIQRQKVKELKEMPENVKTALMLLNYLDGSTIEERMKESVMEQIEIIEKSEFAEYCEPVLTPLKAQLSNHPVMLSPAERNIHSIWVQGDYRNNEELQSALETRKNAKAQTWKNLIWVYETEKEESPEAFEVIDNMACRPIQVNGLNMFEVNFPRTMALWKDKPAWVAKFLPLLNLMLTKKSFVAMSDIMRMIILYYKGGLYQDVKIHLQTPEASFFDEPLVNTDVLQLVDAGSNLENWAMIANACCKMIEDIMKATLAKFPSPSKIATMPENYANAGRYSKAHVSLHEDKGPWKHIEDRRHKGTKTDPMSRVNASLKLFNPRAENSWSQNDEIGFDWGSEPTRQAPQDAIDLDRPGRTFGGMAAEIEMNIDQRESQGQLSAEEANHLRQEFRPLVERIIMQSIRSIELNPSAAETIMADGIREMNAIIDHYMSD